MREKKSTLHVTLQSSNIGNRLQNYAVQKVLENMGCEVTTLVYPLYANRMKKIKFEIKAFLGWCGCEKYKIEKIKYKREKRFDDFSRRYIKKRKRITFYNLNEYDWNSYDYAVTGSDQVWHNWSGTLEELKYFYLMFIPEEKRISLAPSFGFREFPKCDIDIHRMGLKQIRVLSCREEEGIDMIRNLTGRNAELLIDPTLLLQGHEWIEIEKKPRYKVSKRFMLVYFLGNVSIEYCNTCEKIAKERELDIIDIYNINFEKYFCTAPEEFIWLIRHAEYVCTDSFHACVFSIIFGKVFLVFKRIEEKNGEMFGRIETLLNMLGLSNRIYMDSNLPCSDVIDFPNVHRIIVQKRKEFIHYIKKALDSKV